MPRAADLMPGDRRTFTLVDLFAGCGGMTLGFQQTGRFQPIHAVECDRGAAATHRMNFPDCDLFEGLIEDVVALPVADVIVGGPPCQGFSSLNMSRAGLERRQMWRHYLRLLNEARPLAFVMENVPGLLRSEEFRQFSAGVETAGYSMVADVLNAADFGVPQVRRRAIVIGSRVGVPGFPVRTHADPRRPATMETVDLLPWMTFEDAVTAPPRLSREPTGKSWHRSRRPTALSLERYRAIPEPGMNRFDLVDRAAHLSPPCWIAKTTGSTDVFGRLWWDRPALTIRTEFFKPEKGRYLHPEEDRPITVREAARLQSFPDGFVFPEDQSMTAIARQIGNAVPPLLARHLAEALASHLERSESPPPKPGLHQAVGAT